MKLLALILSALASVAVCAAERPYTCSLKVANPIRDSKSSKPKVSGNGAASQTKTVRTKITWPITVSFSGKDFPQEGVVLKCFCIGTAEGEGSMLSTQDVPVKLDEKGKFKHDFVSPEAVMTKSKQRRSGNGGKDSGGDSGTRITGCIVQLVIDGKVERSFETKPVWKKLARTEPLPQEEVLKLR